MKQFYFSDCRRILYFGISSVFIFFLFFDFARASYLSSPLSDVTINSWFDHSTPLYGGNPDQFPNIFTRYDGLVFTGGPWVQGVNWYDGHGGIDFRAASGTPVYASADGVVTEVYPNHQVGGTYIRIWHSTPGLTTYYGHLSTSTVAYGDPVIRGQIIAYSGATPAGIRPHLHFGIYPGPNQNNWLPIDPYGWTGTTTPSGTSCSAFGCAPWTGTTTDPWGAYNQGYLWTTNPPSLTPPMPNNDPPYTPVSGTINQNTTWTAANSPYVIDGSATVNSGVTLTIQPGVVVKFNPQTGGPNGQLIVNGTLNAQGTSASKIYFTSIKDDSVGGDTNGDGNATSPAPGDFDGLKFYTGSIGNFNNIIVRYGGWMAYDLLGAFSIFGGAVVVTNSNFSQNDPVSIYLGSGSLNLNSSQVVNNDICSPLGLTACFIIYTDYGNNSSLNLLNNTFINNDQGGITVGAGINFTSSGNQILNGLKGYRRFGLIYQNTTWSASDYPYVVNFGGIGVPVSKTLTIEAGTIIKSPHFNISGTLNAQGTPTNKIYFTSINDDTVGGDTNNNGLATIPVPGNFPGLIFNSGSIGNINKVVLRYGGGFTNPLSPQYNGAIFNNGGTLNIINTVIKDSHLYGIYRTSGTTTISQSSIHNNTSYGIYNTGINIIAAQNNWWGSVSGPYHPTLNPSGAGNQVSNNVNFIPWLNYDPNAPPPQVCNILTGC